MNMRIKKYDVFVAFIAFALCYLLNTAYSGPAYLSDEVAYLVNAALIAGYRIDGMGSWHAGYSLFLAPLFIILDDPYHIWRGVTLINSFFFSITILLSGKYIDLVAPNIDAFRRHVVLIIVALYPSFAAMTGYAYTSSAYIALFLFSVLAMACINYRSHWQITGLATLVGFMYWVHPIGLATWVAAVIIVVMMSMVKRNYANGMIFVCVSLALILFYKYVFHEWLYEVATPDGYPARGHYRSMSSMLARFSDGERVLNMFSIFAGHASYQIIASFGLVFAGASIVCVKTYRRFVRGGLGALAENRPLVSGGFALISMIGVIALGAVSFSSGGGRSDYWIYGRYTDMVMLPLLIVGASYAFNIKRSVLLGCFILLLFTGGVLKILVDVSRPHSYQSTVSFWPMYIVDEKDFLIWMLIGILGVLLVYGMSRFGRLGSVGCAAIFALSAYVVGANNMEDHSRILKSHSRPSDLVEIVRSNHPPGACIGFDVDYPSGLNLMQRERYRLYLFYLYNYKYRRYDIEEWQLSCDGPLLTYRPEQFIGSETEKIMARENASGLFLVIKDSAKAYNISEDIRHKSEVSFAASDGALCLVANCFGMQAAGLARYTRVGIFQEGLIKSDGRAGYLFHGPYKKLGAGTFHLIVHGEFYSTDTTVIDVVSRRGRVVHYEGKLCNNECPPGDVIVPFKLDEKVDDLEVRLRVGTEDRVFVSGYEIVSPDGEIASRVSGISVTSETLDAIPRQVGRFDGAAILSDGNQGFLAYGPYRQIVGGKYKLLLRGRVDQSETAWVDIVSSQGEVVHGRFPLPETDDDVDLIMEQMIEIDAPVNDIEIRVYVGPGDDVMLYGYDLISQ